MAPEVLCARNHSYAVDFYAIGIMGYEFMFSERPYQGENRKEIMKDVLARQVAIRKEELPDGWSWEAADFINRLLKRKQEVRNGYKRGVCELKEHAWYNGFDWEALKEKRMVSPFTPGAEGNFDRSYCEGTDLLGEDTLCRYEDYMERDGYENRFENYTYVDEEEVRKYLLLQSRNGKEREVKKGRDYNCKNSFRLLKKVCSLANFPNLYSPQHKMAFNVYNLDNQKQLKKNVSDKNMKINHNNILLYNDKPNIAKSPLAVNKPLLLRINTPNHKRMLENNIFTPKSPIMKSSNSITLFSKANLSNNTTKNQTININISNNYHIELSQRNSPNNNNNTKRIKYNDNNIINTKDKSKRIMDKLSKKMMLDDYLFIKNNKKKYSMLKRGCSLDKIEFNSLDNNSSNRRMILPFTIHHKLINKFDSPKYIESKINYYAKAFKNNNNNCNIFN